VPSVGFEQLVDRPPTGPGWLHEVKHDGFRALASKASASIGSATTAVSTLKRAVVDLDAMAKLGATARGVAVVDTSVADVELKRLNDLGVRGIRFNLVQSGATTIDMLERRNSVRPSGRVGAGRSGPQWHPGRQPRGAVPIRLRRDRPR
jgi:hypothetical protein